MPWYKTRRKYDDGHQVHDVGSIIEFPATKEHPKGLAPSTATLLSDDDLALERRKQSAADEAADRAYREKMKQEILAELMQDARNTEQKEQAAEEGAAIEEGAELASADAEIAAAEKPKKQTASVK